MSTRNGARVPSYRLHKQSGQAIVTLNSPGGVRQDVPLGAYGTPASHCKYQRVIAEWNQRGRVPAPPVAGAGNINVAELILRFWEGHVISYYRHPDGTATSEQENYRQALRPLRSLYGNIPANDFDAPKLEAWLLTVTQPLRTVTDPTSGEPRQLPGWCRTNANKNLSRIKSLFRWGVRKKLVRGDVLAELDAVPGLRAGRCDARETDPVRSVPEELIEAIKPFVSRPVAVMAELQVLCGARPGELSAMRTAEVQTTGTAWVFRPAQHKNAHRGHTREIFLGPRAQELLRPLLKRDLQAYVFSPQEAEAERLSKLRAGRTTPLSCGNSPGTNRKTEPIHQPGERYTVAAYRRAIERACAKAFPPPEPFAKQEGETIAQWQRRLTPEQCQELRSWQREHRWHPHQARHTAGTRARERFGPEGAQVFLGHKHIRVTEVYAQTSAALAARVATEIG